MKNADIVRDMTDEELADFFGSCVGDCIECDQCMVQHLCDSKGVDCHDAWKKWMEQDIEED